MENDRLTEHSTTEEEEVHLRYQYRRGHCTLFGQPFSSSSLPISTGAPITLSLHAPIPTTNLHGATNAHSFFWTPLIPIPISTGAPKYTPYSYYQTPRGPQIHTLLGHPSFQYPSPRRPQNTHLHGGPKNTLLWTPPIHTTKHHGGH